MNSLQYEIDSTAGVQNVTGDNEAGSVPKKAKEFMKTPCNHKYHVPCLKKWMEIRLECPSCRTVIPPLEDDD